MLDKIIIIDYTEGSGGEYFSNFITNHLVNKILEDNMQESSDWSQKYFNSLSLVTPNWDLHFEFYLNKFLELCEQNHIKNISIPYHLYKSPKLGEQFQKIAHIVRFIKINDVGYEQQTAFNFLRKIYLKNISNQEFRKIKFRINDFSKEQKLIVIEQLKHNNLYWLDIDLIVKNIPINSDSRQQLVNKILNTRITPPSLDIEISYEDFFIKFENTTDKYYALCKNLDISPRSDLLDNLIVRNRKNTSELDQYIKNFPMTINQL